MNDNWVDVNISYTIFDVVHRKYFKGYYDDGCLYEHTWVNNAVKGTLFNTSANALKQLEDLREDEPDLLMCVVEVKTTCEVSMNF